jgi:predicted PurR-regulated permease PerM
MKNNDKAESETEKKQQKKSNKGFYIAPLVLVGTVLLLWILVQLKPLLIALVFAITLASAITPVAETLEKKKIPRMVTVVLIFLIVGIVYSVLVSALYPTLKEQAISLYESLPNYADTISRTYSRLAASIGENVGAVPSLSVSPAEVKNILSKASQHAVHLTSDIVTVGATAILVMFLTAYFVMEADLIWPKLLVWLPSKKRARAASLIRPIESRLGGYIRGQLLVCVAVSLFLTTGLFILKVDHALLLGALSGLLNLVPFVGSMITAVLALVVAFNQSPQLALLVFLLFALEQWVESNLIVPNLLGKQVELHPLIVLFAILIGASLLGVAGALIAVPIATVLVFLAQEFYLKPLQAEESTSDGSAGSDADIDAFAGAAAILAATPAEPVPTSKSEEAIKIDVSETSKDDA